MCEIARAEPPDGHPDRHPEARELRQVMLEKAVDAGVLEADRVKHSVLRLRDPRWRIPLSGERAHSLRHEGVETPGDLARSQRVETAARVQNRDGQAASRNTGPAMQRRS